MNNASPKKTEQIRSQATDKIKKKELNDNPYNKCHCVFDLNGFEQRLNRRNLMIKEVRLCNFFSFKNETIISLNPGANILVGINGSGKTSFINAFRLLYEGVCGNGFENLFQKEWGGYANVSSAVAGNNAKSIELTFVFDHKRLKKLTPKSPFKSDAYYSVVIKPLGDTGYTIEEKLYATNLKDTYRPYVFLDFKNERGTLSVYHSTGIKKEHFAGDTSGQELILRQISAPVVICHRTPLG